jgi:hypothetical protein
VNASDGHDSINPGQDAMPPGSGDPPMDSSQDSIQFRTLERRHMIAVKTALAKRVTSQPAHVDAQVHACVDYLDYIMGRFVEQGRSNVARLRAAVRSDDLDNRDIIDDIDTTLERTRQALDRLIAARDHFRKEGGQESDFLIACHAFLAFYDQVLASRKDPAQAIVEKYFDPEEYWRHSNDVTEQSIRTEQELFALTGLSVDASGQPEPG